MAFPLKNDKIAYVPILATSGSGTVVPPPGTDSFTVVSSDATKLKAEVTTLPSDRTCPAVKLTPLVQAAKGLSVTVNDTAGLVHHTMVVDIVLDQTPASLMLDLSCVETQPQPVPPATHTP